MENPIITPSEDILPNTCLKCNLVFENHADFMEHKSTHMTMRQTSSFKGVLYECEICKKGYVLKSSLTRHMKKHLIDRIQADTGSNVFVDQENASPQEQIFVKNKRKPTFAFPFRRHVPTDNLIEATHDRKPMVSLLNPLPDNDIYTKPEVKQNAFLFGSSSSVICGKDVKMNDSVSNKRSEFSSQCLDLSLKSTSLNNSMIDGDDIPVGVSNAFNNSMNYDSALDLSIKSSSFMDDTCNSSFDLSFVKTECGNNSSYLDLQSDTPLDLSLDTVLTHRRETYPCDMNTSCPETDMQRFVNFKAVDTFKCKQCPAIFNDRFDLHQHSKTHRTTPTQSIEAGSDESLSLFTCQFCGEQFADKSRFSKHIRNHYREKTFYCQFCCIMFTDKKIFNQHCQTHLSKPTYKCNVCRLHLTDKKEHMQHLKLHTSNDKPFLCGVCYRAFPVKSYLDSHMRTHVESKPFKCPECGKGFSHNFNLTKHLRIHSGEKPYKCSVCTNTFGQRNSLNRHMLTHATASTSNVCQVCHKAFHSRGKLLEHLIEGHDLGMTSSVAHYPESLVSSNESSNDTNDADMCDSQLYLHQDSNGKHETSERFMLKTTFPSGHANDTVKHEDISTDKMQELNLIKEEHVKIEATGNAQDENKTKLDEDCSNEMMNHQSLEGVYQDASLSGVRDDEITSVASSEESNSLDSNEGTYTGTFPINERITNEQKTECVDPEQDMRDRINSINIEGTPSEGYICPECGKTFKTKNYVRSHLKTHLNLKPYACTVCNKTFNHSFNLTKHMRSHTGEQPYACPVCSRRFSHVNSLNRHLILHKMNDLKTQGIDVDMATGEIHDMPSITFECPVCTKAYTDITSLETHISSEHVATEED